MFIVLALGTYQALAVYYIAVCVMFFLLFFWQVNGKREKWGIRIIFAAHFGISYLIYTVELTVALHYVFNTPYDRIVWDVGHQAYGHKILTGRRETFSTNRKFKGIRPFPSPDESDYDTFTCGHASNSISAALGMAVAAEEKEKKTAMWLP